MAHSQWSLCSTAKERSSSPGAGAECAGSKTGAASSAAPLRSAGPPQAGHRALEQLADDAERVLALELGAAGGGHAHAPLARGALGRQQQSRLADAARALHQQRATRAGARTPEELDDLAQLPLAVEQQPRARAHRRTASPS